jgi:hypothetical protein
VVEAVELATRDPELKAWWEAQQAFDRAISDKMKRVTIPEDLREKIVAGRKIEQFRPRQQFTWWIAAAAAVAIFCAIGTSQMIKAFAPISTSEYTAAIMPKIPHDPSELAMTSADREKLEAWLKQQGAPVGEMPGKMAGLPTIGCQKFSVHGHMVSLICFAMSNGAIVHLFVIHEDALSDPPTFGKPDWDEKEGWATASWSDAPRA